MIHCAHGWEWLVVEPDRTAAPSRWLAGDRFLRESCPWCCQWLSTRQAPTSAAAQVVELGEAR